ncbi:MAG: replication factor C large subunit [Desulfurococcaceae archaeon]
MSTVRFPWIMKYRPRNLDEVVNQDKAKKALVEWLKSWESGIPKKKAVLLYGPPGCGKTSLVEAAAKTLKYELFEMNASDSRRKEDIERLAKAASQMTGLRARRKIILLDEIDGLDPRADIGGIDAIINVINNTRNPIIMTANNPFREHLKAIRDLAENIALDRLKDTHVVNILMRICQQENLRCEQKALEEIARRSEGDMRSAINDLEAAAAIDGKVTLERVKAVSTYRNRVYPPWEALRRLFMAKYVFQAKEAITSTDLSPDEFITWINEHIPSWYETPEEVSKAYEALSRADQYLGRIVKTQNWDLLSYALDMMGPGVAFARREHRGKFVPFKMPEKIRLLSESKRSREYRESLAETIARRLLTSKEIIKSDVIPYLRVIFKNNPEYAAKIARSYGLPDELVRWLAGEKAGEILKYMKRESRKK